MLDFITHIRHAKGLRCREEDQGQYLIYCPETDEMHVIGSLEKKIFDLCIDSDFDSIINGSMMVLNEQCLEEEQARNEVFAFLTELHKRKIICYE